MMTRYISQRVLFVLLTVISAISGDCPVPASGFLGEQVVLPCTYKRIVPVSNLLVIWGISEHEILWKFIDGNNDLTDQHPRFRNRTDLFSDQLEQGNWSLLISDLRESDQDEYKCYIYKRAAVGYNLEQTDFVHLSVTERAPTPVPNTPVPDTGLSHGELTAIIYAVFFVGIYVAVIAQSLIKRNCIENQCCRTQNEASNAHPLREVITACEVQSIVTTAPEHQDGMAGEQNLLGNGAVQL
ncbi:CD276 antigen homolog isoform X2 [Stegostoma tigrinum]|uniref:CD276 antigen homolog isoform X2 n=1 Tax=Stegostoma tigrinum TaxID=3053191 RepID=UPI002870658E|nr:CD276 antigen homolog isoform X2 [Stegostoma tigrinum]